MDLSLLPQGPHTIVMYVFLLTMEERVLSICGQLGRKDVQYERHESKSLLKVKAQAPHVHV